MRLPSAMLGRFEVGAASDVSADKVAVLAHWSDRRVVPRSTAALVSELQRADFRVLVVSTSEADAPLAWPDGCRPEAVVRRPNVGYDFGSWAAAMEMVPDLISADRVLLCNDSMVGPFASLSRVIDAFTRTRADAWGLTTSDQFGLHLQSFFVGFSRGVLAEAPLRAFYRRVRDQRSKQDVIAAYELGLSRLLMRHGYALDAYLPSRLVVDPGLNPMILGWRGVLDHEIPLVKRELLRDPGVAPDAHDIPAVLREKYDVDVQDWL